MATAALVVIGYFGSSDTDVDPISTQHSAQRIYCPLLAHNTQHTAHSSLPFGPYHLVPLFSHFLIFPFSAPRGALSSHNKRMGRRIINYCLLPAVYTIIGDPRDSHSQLTIVYSWSPRRPRSATQRKAVQFSSLQFSTILFSSSLRDIHSKLFFPPISTSLLLQQDNQSPPFAFNKPPLPKKNI